MWLPAAQAAGGSEYSCRPRPTGLPTLMNLRPLKPLDVLPNAWLQRPHAYLGMPTCRPVTRGAAR